MKIHSTSAWRRLSGQCYRRDKAKNAECAICHRPIDYDAKPSSYDWAYEPDHRLNARPCPPEECPRFSAKEVANG